MTAIGVDRMLYLRRRPEDLTLDRDRVPLRANYFSQPLDVPYCVSGTANSMPYIPKVYS